MPRRVLSQAYCITQGDLTAFAAKSIRGPTGASTSHQEDPLPEVLWGASQLGLPATGQGDGKYTLEAILAAPDLRTEMNASKIRIQAQRGLVVGARLCRRGWMSAWNVAE